LQALAPLALIGIGIGLVAGARHGSYPILIAIGVVLTILLALGSPDDRPLIGRRFDADIGNHVERPLRAADLKPYRIDTGRLTIDLTRLRLSDRTYVITARVGAGQLIVIVPEGVPIRVRARSSVGNIRVPGEGSSGFGADQSFEAPGYDVARPRFDLNLRVGVGSIHVTQDQRDRVRVENIGYRLWSP
jgi:hypothetical protein